MSTDPRELTGKEAEDQELTDNEAEDVQAGRIRVEHLERQQQTLPKLTDIRGGRTATGVRVIESNMEVVRNKRMEHQIMFENTN